MEDSVGCFGDVEGGVDVGGGGAGGWDVVCGRCGGCCGGGCCGGGSGGGYCANVGMVVVVAHLRMTIFGVMVVVGDIFMEGRDGGVSSGCTGAVGLLEVWSGWWCCLCEDCGGCCVGGGGGGGGGVSGGVGGGGVVLRGWWW